MNNQPFEANGQRSSQPLGFDDLLNPTSFHQHQQQPHQHQPYLDYSIPQQGQPYGFYEPPPQAPPIPPADQLFDQPLVNFNNPFQPPFIQPQLPPANPIPYPNFLPHTAPTRHTHSHSHHSLNHAHTSTPNPNSLTIRLPPMTPSLRRSTRNRTDSLHSQASGSVYHDESNNSMDVDGDVHDEDAEGEEDDEETKAEPVEYTHSRSGRKIAKRSYVESEDDDEALPGTGAGGRRSGRLDADEEDGGGILNGLGLDDDEEEEQPRRRRRKLPSELKPLSSDEAEGSANGTGNGRRYSTRSRSKKPDADEAHENGRASRSNRRSARRQEKPAPVASSRASRSRRSTRASAAASGGAGGGSGGGRPGLRTRRSAREEDDADGYVDNPEPSDNSAEHSFEEVPSSEPEPEEVEIEVDADGDVDGEGEVEIEEPANGKPYSLRRRQKVNYAIPPPLEEVALPESSGRGGDGGGGRRKAGGGYGRSGTKKGPGWSASGAELGRFLGLPGDDSDSDAPTRRKGFGAPAFAGAGGVNAGGSAILPGDLAAAAGAPSNFGKVGDAALADADPLGVNQNVTFDEVGGLDNHINALKEMTLLPLLYPEVFQRFNLVPPRGVLFHGPPGTGKTLLARALAASCRSNGKGISFFMRKGADVLSKWVGEAERQLRLLFEEARNCQPSIIFFDEIDGLAPVRSSKQDQIHASLVSTLLALMDGMDGRGQVVVIGATNRPDAVDPALRRPGRFDREFYFPLPDLGARRKILGIMTKKWQGWEEGREEDVEGLAKLTKGYGGADLRALCTEAALNAVQRRYPQIYKSNDRLLLQPETIGIELRDFMISVKKIVPSSARSSSSVAAPLPTQFVPLLSEALDRVKEVLTKVMPLTKKRTALEEAEWEDVEGDGTLARELMLQSMETLRVYRPRIVLHGPSGMGQQYVGTATLHHLEGYHVQNLDLGTLMGDATRTVEAGIVQLFVEAKRLQPSIIYIPSLVGWCAAVPETSRSTVRAMLDTLSPTDPILLLAVVDGPFLSLPRDVRAWFGSTRENRIDFRSPTQAQRDAFFQGLLDDVKRKPIEFPDGVKRKKRVLEELPIAPPLEPRKPTVAELAVQEEQDARLITLLRYRLGPILTELKRKFKRFTKRAIEEYQFDDEDLVTPPQEPAAPAPPPVPTVEAVTTTIEIETGPNGVVEHMHQDHTEVTVRPPETVEYEQAQQMISLPPPPASEPAPEPGITPRPKLYNMDLERMHLELYKNRYLTPQDFLDDVGKMVHNAEVRMYEDPERLHRAQAMYTATEVSVQEFEPGFRLECERMAGRERQRRQERKEQRREQKRQEEQAAARRSGSVLDGDHPGVRRSGRNNGKEPEMTLTDPLLLERKLKRQRSRGGSNDSKESGEDNVDGGRGNKRSRVASEDPLNIGAGPSSLDQGANAHNSNVHWADDASAPALPQINDTFGATLPNGDVLALEPDKATTPLAQMSGFDPSLLNPASPAQPQRYFTTPRDGQELPPIPSSFDNTPQPTPSLQPSTSSSQPAFPFQQQVDQNYPMPSNSATPQPQASTSTGHPSTAEQPAASPSSHQIDPSLGTSEVEPQLPHESMEVDRAPTPLPDFHLPEFELDILRRELRDETGSLSVEQLEQLRAMCLGTVWRRRSEWDRYEMVKELRDVVREFVEEVRMDMDEDGM